MAYRWAANSTISTKALSARPSRRAALFSRLDLLQRFCAVHQIDQGDALGMPLDPAHGSFDLADILGRGFEMIAQFSDPLAQALHVLQQRAHRPLDSMG